MGGLFGGDDEYWSHNWNMNWVFWFLFESHVF
jgi:hypothetical protein